jgi:hypothetical protein
MIADARLVDLDDLAHRLLVTHRLLLPTLLFTGHVEEGEFSAITRGRRRKHQCRLLATKPLRCHNDALRGDGPGRAVQ